MRAFAVLGALLLLAGCVAPPQDPFDRAEFELARDDLLGALHAYDAVPSSHPRYPDARAAAVGLEVRMRRCQELLLEGLRLRSEWRDEEALQQFHRAAEQWPDEPGLEQWIAVTEQRVVTFGRAAAPTPPPAAPAAEVVSRAPQGAGVAERATAPAAPASTRPASRSPEKADVPGGAAVEVASEPASSTASPEVHAALRSLDVLRERGQQQQVLSQLEALAKQFPHDPRVTRRLASLLHQRALLRYGRGELATAVADWSHVLLLAPAHRAAQQMLARARAELQSAR